VDTDTRVNNTVSVFDVDAGRVTSTVSYVGINATLLIDDRYNQNESADVALIYIGPSMDEPALEEPGGIDNPNMAF
jgi:hypothetical protein